MASRRWNGEKDTTRRTALLDAAERLMVEEGYAAVTSRRVAREAGVHQGLVYYYFGAMDDLYLAVFRRHAQRTLEREAAALAAHQPLWALWDVIRERAATALIPEFLALGNHRKAIREEIRDYTEKFRRLQVEGLSETLERYGVDRELWPASAVIVFIDGMSRYLATEDAYGLEVGHAEAVAVFERLIGQLEGARGASTART